MRRLRAHVTPCLLALGALALFVASPAITGSDEVHASAPVTAYGADPAELAVDVEYDAGDQVAVLW